MFETHFGGSVAKKQLEIEIMTEFASYVIAVPHQLPAFIWADSKFGTYNAARMFRDVGHRYELSTFHHYYFIESAVDEDNILNQTAPHPHQWDRVVAIILEHRRTAVVYAKHVDLGSICADCAGEQDRDLYSWIYEINEFRCNCCDICRDPLWDSRLDPRWKRRALASYTEEA